MTFRKKFFFFSFATRFFVTIVTTLSIDEILLDEKEFAAVLRKSQKIHTCEIC
jgi:hypothetical protein